MKIVAYIFFIVSLLSSTISRADTQNRWATYMHGIKDINSTPVKIEDIFSAASFRKDTLPENRAVSSIAVARGDKLLSRPLPVNINALKSKNIRLFFWAKGESDIPLLKNSYGASPNFRVIQKDKNGSIISKSKELPIGTVGKFPWHCYYLDTYISPKANYLLIEIYSSSSDAYFASPSWELITDENKRNLDQKQDPATGSLASNVLYDRLNRQFGSGIAYAHPWKFLAGPEAGLKGNQYNISSISGLESYFREVALTDEDHLNHSIMYLGSRYQLGKAAGVLPTAMNDAWLKKLTELVLEAQDPQTGFWGTKYRPQSMGITFHFVNGLFGHYGVIRTDEAPRLNNERILSVLEIPNAQKIIETTLKMQQLSTATKGAWSRKSYNFNEQASKQTKASLLVTGNAIELLRRCSYFVPDQEKKKVDAAIEASVLYTIKNLVKDDGSWIQEEDDSDTSDNRYLPRVIEYSSYLEKKVNFKPTKEPSIEVQNKTNGYFSIKVSDFGDANSIRFYSTKDASVGSPDEGKIIGIVNGGGRIFEMDPLIVANKIQNAGRKLWGSKPFKDGTYTARKLELARAGIANAPDSNETLTIHANNGQKVFYSSVSSYGNESRLTELE